MGGATSTEFGPSAFEGRTVVVTGGGWNIGRAIGRAYAQHGARVVLASRTPDRLEATAAELRDATGNPDVLAVPTDVTDLGQVEALVARALEAFERIDVFAAIAGGGSVYQPIDEMDPAAWDRIFRQNVTGTFHCLRAVLPHFRARNAGNFITCSGGGSYYPVLGSHLNAYACAKAAICRFTDQMTAELWETPIRINCLDPGMVWSPDTVAKIEAEEKASGAPHPLREVARPAEDAAELALWLGSERSAPLRGRLVSVQDDWWRDPDRVARVHDTVHLYRMRRVEESTTG